MSLSGITEIKDSHCSSFPDANTLERMDGEQKMNFKNTGKITILGGFVILTLISSGCTKKKTCPMGQKWVDKQCVCKLDSNCPKNMVCLKGKCVEAKKTCPDVPCPDGRVCDAGTCRNCNKDAECGKGKFCDNGTCKPVGNQCSPDHDCPLGQKCVNGYCVTDNGKAPSCMGSACASPCDLVPVFFDYKAARVHSGAKSALKANMACLHKAVAKGVNRVHMMGLADPRGPTTFNDDLSSQRIKNVMDEMTLMDPALMKKITVSTEPLGETCAKGTDEDTWKKDRRVEMVWFKKSSQVCP
ncbi:hypothetical protein KKD49_15565 [Myxococcota bacterium]|nr:hypothetical protein [Myxococcota bacterium]